jgi:histidinol-phosphate/aromatic aminotransferase/cobyric acid decarboxylase-like protein
MRSFFSFLFSVFVRILLSSSICYISFSSHLQDVCSGGAGNFVCIRVPGHVKPLQLVGALESEQIYIRDISGRFPGFVRVTIGLEMERVAKALIAAYEKLQQ